MLCASHESSVAQTTVVQSFGLGWCRSSGAEITLTTTPSAAMSVLRALVIGWCWSSGAGAVVKKRAKSGIRG